MKGNRRVQNKSVYLVLGEENLFSLVCILFVYNSLSVIFINTVTYFELKCIIHLCSLVSFKTNHH